MDGKRAKSTEIGSNRKTTGSNSAISALPALRSISFFESTWASFSKAVRTGTSGVPRSMAIEIELLNRLDPGLPTRRAKLSIARTADSPSITSFTIDRNSWATRDSLRPETTCIARTGDMPAEIINVIACVMPGNSKSTLFCQSFFSVSAFRCCKST